MLGQKRQGFREAEYERTVKKAAMEEARELNERSGR